MLKICEHANKYLEVQNSSNNLDKVLAPDIPAPLPNYSGFNMLIVGASGSGKTTLLYSIMSKKHKKKRRQSYRKVFDKVYIISPTIGGTSIKKDPFKSIPEGQKQTGLSLQGLEKLEEELYDNREDGVHSVVILDDVGSQLRKNAQIEKKLIQMLQNRRHVFTSYIALLQRFRDCPPGWRNNLSHFVSFRPKNQPEYEAITKELMPYDSKKNKQIMDHIFETDNNYCFIFIDMSLKTTNKYLFYNCFNPLEITDSDD
jgi:ABC-type dipeptide/oligopeptide/nickel transport system ATPase component